MLQFSQFVWTPCYSVRDVIKNFLFIDATDRSKIIGDQKRFFIALSLYPLSFFANTPFKSTIQRSKRFVKILKNMRSRSRKVEQIREFTKSAVSLVFHVQLGYFSLFCKTMFSVEYGLKRRIFCCSYRHILRRKNTLSVFYQKKPFAIVNFNFSEKCLL